MLVLYEYAGTKENLVTLFRMAINDFKSIESFDKITYTLFDLSQLLFTVNIIGVFRAITEGRCS
jgi:hypothetical protein